MIAIIDYGLGNISAFANVFDKINQPFFSSPVDRAMTNG